jgi:predicted porin
MKKKLLAVAVGATLAASAGISQAADVKVYGKAHVSWDYNMTDAAADPTDFSFVSDNSSRFGVKAVEDLGGGTKALFQVEIATRTDTATALSSNRNSYAGLSTNFGTIMLGKYDSPFKDVGRIADQFNERIGDARNVIGNGGAGSSVSWDRRVPNMARYVSPSFGGVTITGQYSSGDSTTAGGSNNGEQGSANVVWQAGGAKIGAAYNVQSTASGTESFESGYRIAGTYKFGMFMVGALYEGLSDILGVSGADRSAYGVSGSVTLAEKHVIKAQYFVADSISAAALQGGGSLYAIGYDYKFSKTATGYVVYAGASNDSNTARYTPSSSEGGHGDNVTTQLGGSPSALSVGMELVF